MATDYYVNPMGNDQWSGGIKQPTAQESSHIPRSGKCGAAPRKPGNGCDTASNQGIHQESNLSVFSSSVE